MNLFTTNNQIHSVHTLFKTNLHPPTANLTKFEKGVYYSAIKTVNNVPHEIKDLANKTIQFRNALKRFLLSNSFITVKNILTINDYLVRIQLMLLLLDVYELNTLWTGNFSSIFIINL
jgi:hypothetical protein